MLMMGIKSNFSMITEHYQMKSECGPHSLNAAMPKPFTFRKQIFLLNLFLPFSILFYLSLYYFFFSLPPPPASQTLTN